MRLLQLVELRWHGLLKHLASHLLNPVRVVMMHFNLPLRYKLTKIGNLGCIHNGVVQRISATKHKAADTANAILQQLEFFRILLTSHANA